MAATTNPLAGEPARPADTEAEHRARLAHERALLDEAREDVKAGRVIPDGESDAWLDLLVRGEPLPMPDAPSASHPK